LWPPGKAGYHRVVITRGTPVPPYQQLAAIIRSRIESGELAPGQQLPSVIRLAADYEVAVPTVRKAITLLKAEGLVTGVAGYGTFVADKKAPRQP
jgi:DNA-binding GntR family transcriptional regulator